MSALDLGRIIRRDELLERLERLQPRIVALIAPAGFGKSTLARQLVESSAAFAVCECAHVEDDLDFARRIVPALADEDPSRGAELSQRELMLGDGAMSPHERVALALKAWQAPAKPSTFVLEDAEHIAASPSAREFLTRLLAGCPDSRRIVICSRESLRVHLSRFAPPHRILTLRGDNLAFTREELERIFDPVVLDTATIDRIHEISQGWPVPVLFLARLAAEGRHEIVLDRLNDVAFEELYEYLADQVLDALPPFLTAALFAAAAIPNADANDLVLATRDDNAVDLLAEFERSSPFVRRTGEGTFVVHPLVRAMLLEGASARRDELLARVARAYGERGDHLRAAELQLVRSAPEDAAQALELVPVGEDRAPSMRYSRMVASLDRATVRRYPTLWSCSALLQTFSTDSAQLLEETGTLWASLPPETPLHKRYYVLATRVLQLTYLGMFDEALALLERVAPRASIPDPPATREHGYALYLRATVIARLGRIDEAERDLDVGWPLIEPMDVMASAALMIRGAEIARPRGHRAEERELLALSLEYARRSQLSNFVAFRLAEAAFGAWLAGEDDAFASFGAELEAIVEHHGIRGFQYFADCVRGRHASEPRDVDLVRWILCGHLVSACGSQDDVSARAHANAARELTRRYPTPFLRTLAAVVCAELAATEDDRAAAHAEARDASRASGSAALPEDVERFAAGAADAGMLAPLVARLRARRAGAKARLQIAILEGTVRRSGREIKLPERELELLFALARRRQVVTREQLAEMLWPDRDDDEATWNALKVHLYRLRQHLGDDTVIVRTRDGLQLSDEVDVDLWEIERAVATRRSRGIANDADRASLAALHDRLRAIDRAPHRGWEWFEPTERTARELRCEVARTLARDALACGRKDEALRLAQEMIEIDACDETAREIAIAAYVAQGDRAAALRHYRQYRDVLYEELQCEPSAALTALLQPTTRS